MVKQIGWLFRQPYITSLFYFSKSFLLCYFPNLNRAQSPNEAAPNSVSAITCNVGGQSAPIEIGTLLKHYSSLIAPLTPSQKELLPIYVVGPAPKYQLNDAPQRGLTTKSYKTSTPNELTVNKLSFNRNFRAFQKKY